MKAEDIRILFNSRTIFKTLLIILAVLTVLHLLSAVSSLVFHHLIEVFDFDTEASIPTFFSACVFLLNALLFYLIARTRQTGSKMGAAWLPLSVIFLFLAIDEAAQVHEKFGGIIEPLLPASGLFYYVWIIPYFLFTAIVGLITFNTIRHVPTAIRNLFVLSAALFLSGSLGLEMLGGAWDESHGRTPTYTVLYSFEELFEFLGVIVLAYAQLRLLERHFGGLQISIGSASVTTRESD